jgi:exodeoxyribonuclease VII large subunit
MSWVWSAIADHAVRGVAGQDDRVAHTAARVDRAARAGLETAQRRLDGQGGRVAGAARAHVRAAEVRRTESARRLRHRAPRALAEAERALASLDARVRANDPDRTLARGWSITRAADGRLVRSPDDVAVGDELRTLVAGGEVRSTVAPASTVDSDG